MSRKRGNRGPQAGEQMRSPSHKNTSVTLAKAGTQRP